MKLIGGYFVDKIIDEVKKGKKLQGIGDNWDIRVFVYDMKNDYENKDFYYFVLNLIVDRVLCEVLV